MDREEDRLAEVAGLIERAKDARLDGADMLEAHGLLWCLKNWNGAGPEFLPKRVRDRLTDHLAFFAPALLIHDADFALSDGKITTFQAANERLRSNCRRLVLDAHPFFFSLARWKRLALSDLMAGKYAAAIRRASAAYRRSKASEAIAAALGERSAS